MGKFKYHVSLFAQALSILGLFVFARLWPGPWNRQRLVGLILVAGGVFLVFLARLQLGTSFSILPRAQKLVTHGLYSRIRNPIYVFGTIAVVGIVMILQIPQLWVLPAGVAIMQVIRARKEADVLEAKFGEEYRSYRKQTWF